MHDLMYLENRMHDLMYLENLTNIAEFTRLVGETFPSAVLKKVYDEIHEHRLEVDVKCEPKDWYVFIARNGYGEVSFSLQLLLAQSVFPDKEERRLLLREIVKELK